MIRFYPESALVQLEFNKVKVLLETHCHTVYAKQRANELRIHTKKEYIETELHQSYEFLQLIQQGSYFPLDQLINLEKELKLLSISGAVLNEMQLMELGRLAENLKHIFHWFDVERKAANAALAHILDDCYYEKAILAMIDEVLDEQGNVKDNASDELSRIRTELSKQRAALRRMFEKVLKKWQKAGYVADIEESFLNGRRVVALFAEQKRQVKGILHGESESRKTAFIEPEETIELNNEVFSLENEERRELYRILRALTARLSVYAPLLKQYHDILGQYDFIRAKAKLGNDMHGSMPAISEKAVIDLREAFHPLLRLYNDRSGKTTIPTHFRLDERNRILVISGPNAGGKTVTLKTAGLLQLMVQSGLLVPAHPDSTFGIFRQIMIHIGDTQSLEYDLSTYSAHLKNMKYFMETANGRTLFFIDELGSGSDPNLGGAFAEVIMQELVKKHALGVVTTHYLNLKVMANHTPGVINGAMSFDEKSLLPLYKLILGKPGSSYTFAIAERIGLNKSLIENARKLVAEDHFRLDKLLNRTEQDLRRIEHREKELAQLLKENERLKKQMEQVMDREAHRRQVELQKEQNRITDERITYLKDMERKLKAIVQTWKRADDKEELLKQMNALLFRQKEKQVAEKKDRKFDEKYLEVGGMAKEGDQVKMVKNRQVGRVKSIRGNKAVVQLGNIPITVALSELVVVQQRPVSDAKASNNEAN